MKKIQQPTTTNFSAIDFKDALTMLPLMNALVREINHTELTLFHSNMDREERLKYFLPSTEDTEISLDKMKAIYKLLTEFGFIAEAEFVKPSVELLKAQK